MVYGTWCIMGQELTRGWILIHQGLEGWSGSSALLFHLGIFLFLFHTMEFRDNSGIGGYTHRGFMIRYDTTRCDAMEAISAVSCHRGYCGHDQWITLIYSVSLSLVTETGSKVRRDGIGWY